MSRRLKTETAYINGKIYIAVTDRRHRPAFTLYDPVTAKRIGKFSSLLSAHDYLTELDRRDSQAWHEMRNPPVEHERDWTERGANA